MNTTVIIVIVLFLVVVALTVQLQCTEVQFYWLGIFCRLQQVHADRKELKDTSYDLCDTVTLGTLGSQLEKNKLKQSLGHWSHLWFS